jgi:AcrR family transcriptional regulator
MSAEILDKAADAALALAAERPWREVSLRDIAARAQIALADLFACADGKGAILDHLSARFDRGALAAAEGEGDDVHDRLFDATMGRIEAMEPHRAALTAMFGPETALRVATHLPRTARAILEAAGVDATPPRLAAMSAVWARCVQVWRDDEGALNRTMAEIDRRLKQMRQALGKVHAGF